MEESNMSGRSSNLLTPVAFSTDSAWCGGTPCLSRLIQFQIFDCRTPIIRARADCPPAARTAFSMAFMGQEYIPLMWYL